MKLNMKYVIFGCVLILVTLLTMATSCGAIPYLSDARPYAITEGFDVDELKRNFDSNLTYFLQTLGSKSSSIENKFIEDETSMIENIQKKKNYDVKMIENQLNIAAGKFGDDSNTHKMIKEFINDKLQPIIDAANASERDALIVSAKTTTDTAAKTTTDTAAKTTTEVQGFTTMTDTVYTIDKFSSAVGNQSCVKTSSGLSNSTGALCLSEEQLYLLQSRGGNSTGRDSQIGM